MTSDDRRRWRRLRSELRLHLQLLENGGRTVPAVGTHLNPEGIFVQMADPPAVGTRVKVTLSAEGTDGLLTAEGVVVSRELISENHERPPGCGLNLDKTGPAWRKLYTWLSSTSD